MRRVCVLGCSGAGKTTLARELAAALGVPVVHGDLHRAEWERVWPELLAGEAWVVDAMRLGTLEARLARADTAVFLDLPLRACLAGVARRRLVRGEPVTLSMLRWMLRFRRRHRPRVLAVLAAHAGSARIVVLRSRSDADAFLANVRRRHGEVVGTAPRGAGRTA